MPPAIKQVVCPRYPDHGMAKMRWLHHDDRQMITKGDGDVFEIDCTHCGKYEYRPPENDPDDHYAFQPDWQL